MESSVQQHLHSLTLRTLHAHSFNRASSLAAHTLTDVLGRYLSLLALTAKQHAEHSGRDSAGANVWDVMEALAELGVGLEELEGFLSGDGNEMRGYGMTMGAQLEEVKDDEENAAGTSAAARRIDSLADIMLATSEGLPTDPSDAFPLEYRRVSSPGFDSPSSAPSSTLHSPEPLGVGLSLPNGFDLKGKGKEILFNVPADPNAMDISSPAVQFPLVLPLSPISNPYVTPPSSPSLRSHKRPRNASWNPPDHIPDFFPPFPGSDLAENTIVASDRSTVKPSGQSAPPRRVPLPLRPATISKSSYTKSIPYPQSSIASKFGDLPGDLAFADPVVLPPTPGGSGSKSNKSKTSLQPLIAAYHVLRSEVNPATNPTRLRVAHLLAGSAPTRYSAPDTLFAASSPPPPRFPPPLPTHAVPIPLLDGPAPKDATLPKLGSKAISDTFRVVDDPSMPWLQGNLMRFARDLLSPHVYAKVTRLQPPSALRPPHPGATPNAEPAEPLLYHKPISAPWNSSAAEADDLRRKEAKKTANGRDSGSSSKKLPDADLFATWDWTTKDPEEPLVARRGRLTSYATASFVGKVTTGPGTPGAAGLFSPSLNLTSNGLRSPAPSGARGFVLPGLPASAMRTNGASAERLAWEDGAVNSPVQTSNGPGSLLIKTSNRRASLNAIDSLQ